jgi:predicted dehydrogenase
MSETGPLRWGILSTARIVEELLPGFAASESAELLAVASRDAARAESFAGEAGIPRSYGSYAELLADEEIDCVYVPLPNGMHAEWTRAALAAGKHVLCEKPLTPTAEEARALFEAAEESGLVLMEAFMYRHHPKTRALREIAGSGRVGEPRVLRTKFHFTVEDPATDIRYDAELSGGALRDVGCYCVSLSNYLAGSAPEEIGASARMADSGVDETFSATMRYPSGLLAVFDCGMASPLDVGVELLGTEGRAVIEMPWYAHREPLSITVVDADGESVEPALGGNAYQLEIENFCAAVRGDESAEISREETLRNLETIERLLAVASDPRVAA